MSDRDLLFACVSTAVLGLILSAYLHSPWATPTLYSDIGSFWARSWVSAGQLPNSSPSTFFEYPPISGLILFASKMVGGDYPGYYTAFSLFSVFAAGVLGWSTWRLSRAVGVKANPLFFIFPSIIVYGVYNFDVFNAMFIVLGLQFFAEKRRDLSAVAIGLGIATKLVAVVLIPVFLFELTSGKERARYLLLAGVATGVFFIPILAFNPGFFRQFLDFFSAWGLEDAWYLWIFGSPFSSAAKVFGTIVLAILLVRVYTLKVPVVQRSVLALGAYVLSTYISAPQFNVMLIPLLAIVSVDISSVMMMEVFNALIILTWFSVPATSTGGPTYPWTVPQLMALLRSIGLSLVMISVASGSGHSPIGWVKGRLKSKEGELRLGTGPQTPSVQGPTSVSVTES